MITWTFGMPLLRRANIKALRNLRMFDRFDKRTISDVNEWYIRRRTSAFGYLPMIDTSCCLLMTRRDVGQLSAKINRNARWRQLHYALKKLSLAVHLFWWAVFSCFVQKALQIILFVYYTHIFSSYAIQLQVQMVTFKNTSHVTSSNNLICIMA